MELNSARNVLQESGAMKVALIATYPEMSRILQELVQGTKIEILDIYASFADAAEKAGNFHFCVGTKCACKNDVSNQAE